MNKKSKIYVAGHTGFIGSAIIRELKKQGYTNLLLRTHKQLDLTNQSKVDMFFKNNKPEYVFLFSARVGGIYANNTFPAEFIFQNLSIQTNIINASYKYKVKKLLFPGSACMYPKYCKQPMDESMLLTGKIEPTNEPFAIAKLAGINMCRSYNRQYKTNFITVVPATAYGEGDHFDANGHVVSGLMDRFHKGRSKTKNEDLIIWGSGKPKREFIYVDDVANACIFLMEKYKGNELIHIGSGEEISMKGLAQKIKKVVDIKGHLVCDTTKPDGIPRRKLDSTKIFKMGWKPKVSLAEGLRRTYRWYKMKNEK